MPMDDRQKAVALMLAKKRGEMPQDVDGDGGLQEYVQPGLNALQAQRDKIIKDKLAREAGIEALGGRVPLAEGDIQRGQAPAAIQTMDNPYQKALQMKQEMGDYPSGAMGKAMQDMEEKMVTEPNLAKDPAAANERFIQLRNYWLNQGR